MSSISADVEDILSETEGDEGDEGSQTDNERDEYTEDSPNSKKQRLKAALQRDYMKQFKNKYFLVLFPW